MDPLDPWQTVVQPGREEIAERPRVTVVVPCYNEQDNVEALTVRVLKAFEAHQAEADFEMLFIDNASTDGTVSRIEALIEADSRIGLIVSRPCK